MELSMQIVNEFSKDLNKNFIFSPFSMNILLSIVACGLKTGASLDRLLSFLGFKSLDDLKAKAAHDYDKLKAIFDNVPTHRHDDDEEPPILSSVNGSWLDKKYTLNPYFHHVLQTLFHAESFTLDFQNQMEEAITEINSWGDKATKGLIKEFLRFDNNHESTALILANALYFKASWSDKFDESKTRTENFYTINGDIVRVDFMCKRYDYCSYASAKGFKVLSLPYSNDPLSSWFNMYIFLPDEKDGLPNLLDQFSSNPDVYNLQFEFRSLEVELMVPKFKFKCKFNVSENMERLGLKMVPEDFSEMLEGLHHENAPFNNMKIFQSCSIEVNEYGTEAAALTCSDICGSSFYSLPRADFIADHPFLFLITEGCSKTTLFLGAVVNPSN